MNHVIHLCNCNNSNNSIEGLKEIVIHGIQTHNLKERWGKYIGTVVLFISE